jgi:hypothetical protein
MTIKDVAEGFQAAVESATTKVEATLPKQKKKGGKEEEVKKKVDKCKYSLQGDNVFNAVVQLSLLDLLPAIDRYLKLSGRPEGSKDAGKAKIRQLTSAHGWSNAAVVVRKYSASVHGLLDCLGDSDALVAVLKHVHQLAPYFLALVNKLSISKMFTKALVVLWSSSSSEPVRLLAFMSILRIVRSHTSGNLDWTMKVSTSD